MATMLSAQHVAQCRGEPCTSTVLHADGESAMQDQEAAEEQYAADRPGPRAAQAEFDSDAFDQALAPQPRRVAAHLTLVIVAAALLLR